VEVQSEQDQGWYEADLTLIKTKGKPKLKADFCDYEDDEEIMESWEDVLPEVRFQSIQVQEHECARVLEGMTVCALRKVTGARSSLTPTWSGHSPRP